jgi:hypothetical protein
MSVANYFQLPDTNSNEMHRIKRVYNNYKATQDIQISCLGGIKGIVSIRLVNFFEVSCHIDWNLCLRCVFMKIKENVWIFYIKLDN